MGCLKLSYYEQSDALEERCFFQGEALGKNALEEKKRVRDYRYGFNGEEVDNEIKGNGNSVNYKARIYDPRIGKFLSRDPLATVFPWYTPYQFAGNKPIWASDLDGLEEFFRTDYYNAVGGNLYKTEIRMVSQKGAAQGVQTVHHTNVREVIDGAGNSSFNVSFTGSRTGRTQGGNAFLPPINNNGISAQVRRQALKVDGGGNPVPKDLGLYEGLPSSITVNTVDLSTGTVSSALAIRGQLVPVTTGGHFNVGYNVQLLDASNVGVGYANRNRSNPSSGFRKYGSAEFTVNIPGASVPANSPRRENNVPNYVGGNRTIGSNFHNYRGIAKGRNDGRRRSIGGRRRRSRTSRRASF